MICEDNLKMGEKISSYSFVTGAVTISNETETTSLVEPKKFKNTAIKKLKHYSN